MMTQPEQSKELAMKPLNFDISKTVVKGCFKEIITKGDIEKSTFSVGLLAIGIEFFLNGVNTLLDERISEVS